MSGARSDYDDGGVLHSKAMVVDREVVFLGSANFDWRALEHIQELGALVHSEPLARAMAAARSMLPMAARWMSSSSTGSPKVTHHVSWLAFPVVSPSPSSWYQSSGIGGSGGT